MTTRKLRSLCRMWQKLLGLDFWTINARFASQAELADTEGEFCFGRCAPDLDRMHAEIRVFRERDMSKIQQIIECGDVEAETELALIHELLHVCLDPTLRINGDGNHELGLDRAARALKELHDAANG